MTYQKNLMNRSSLNWFVIYRFTHKQHHTNTTTSQISTNTHAMHLLFFNSIIRNTITSLKFLLPTLYKLNTLKELMCKHAIVTHVLHFERGFSSLWSQSFVTAPWQNLLRNTFLPPPNLLGPDLGSGRDSTLQTTSSEGCMIDFSKQ